MANHLTSDGLLSVDHCQRIMRYREENADGSAIILQDECTAEPRVGLTITDTGHDTAYAMLDVTRATALYRALGEFLRDSRGQTGWQYGGVVYDLDKAWEGRPGTGLEGQWFRHFGTFQDGLPIMGRVDIPPEASASRLVATLAEVLGLKPCSVHKIWSSPCYACDLGDVGELSALIDGEPYGTGFEPRGDQ